MAKVKVFLSFEFDKDADLYFNFFQQARRGDSCHDLEDYEADLPNSTTETDERFCPGSRRCDSVALEKD